MLRWLSSEGESGRANLCYCDSVGALGGRHLVGRRGVHCMDVSTGRTKQAFDRLSTKVLDNIVNFQNTIGETRF